MFPQLTFAKYAIAAAIAAAFVGGFYWKAYRDGENHAVAKQVQHDTKAQQKANDVRNRDIGVDPSKLLENDPFLRK
jgi:hypothetical protein